jgi:hypothetical protein
MRVEFGASEITITGNDPERGEAVDACEWERLSGPDLLAGFKAKPLAWATGTFGEAATLLLEITDAGGALVVTRVDDKGRASLRIAMPYAIK